MFKFQKSFLATGLVLSLPHINDLKKGEIFVNNKTGRGKNREFIKSKLNSNLRQTQYGWLRTCKPKQIQQLYALCARECSQKLRPTPTGSLRLILPRRTGGDFGVLSMMLVTNESCDLLINDTLQKIVSLELLFLSKLKGPQRRYLWNLLHLHSFFSRKVVIGVACFETILYVEIKKETQKRRFIGARFAVLKEQTTEAGKLPQPSTKHPSNKTDRLHALLESSELVTHLYNSLAGPTRAGAQVLDLRLTLTFWHIWRINLDNNLN